MSNSHRYTLIEIFLKIHCILFIHLQSTSHHHMQNANNYSSLMIVNKLLIKYVINSYVRVRTLTNVTIVYLPVSLKGRNMLLKKTRFF